MIKLIRYGGFSAGESPTLINYIHLRMSFALCKLNWKDLVSVISLVLHVRCIVRSSTVCEIGKPVGEQQVLDWKVACWWTALQTTCSCLCSGEVGQVVGKFSGVSWISWAKLLFLLFSWLLACRPTWNLGIECEQWHVAWGPSSWRCGLLDQTAHLWRFPFAEHAGDAGKPDLQDGPPSGNKVP